MSISEIGGLAMMLKPRTLLSVLVLLLSSPALAQSVAAPFTSGARYDIAGRVTGTISAPASGTQGPFLATRNSYDASGNLSTVEAGQLAGWQSDSIAPANWGASFTPAHTTSYSYDSYGRKTKEQLYAGAIAAGQITAVTQYSYDLYGRLVCTAVRMDPAQWSGQSDPCVPQTTGPNGADRITRMSYDYLGDVTVIQRAVGTPLQQNYETYTWSLSNGGAGRPATIADANGNLTSYTYSVTGLNLLTQANFPSPTTAGQSSSTDYEAYAYDANGNRTSLRKRDGVTITYLYDALNRVTLKTVPASATGAAGYSVYQGYDNRGLLLYARFSSTAGLGITNSYDGFGRLTSFASNMDGTSRTFSAGYDADGNRLTLSGTGYWAGFDYDGLDRMKAVHDGSLTTPAIVTIAYDPLGRRSSLGQGPGAAYSSTTYAYDGASRLQTMTHDLAGTVNDQVLGFGYNPASQIVSRTRSNSGWEYTGQVAGAKTYAVNGLNQYLTNGSATFGYDANGNLSSDGTNTYIYDAENRLVSVTGGTSVTMSYDPLGRLWQYAAPSGSGTVRFLYDGDQLVQELNTAGTVQRNYIHGPGLDEPLIWYEYTGGTLRHYFHADQQGSIVAVADDAGNALAIDKYDEWGVPASGNATVVGAPQRFQYTGQVWLPDLGLYYYKARIYSSRLGRFLQTDPVGYKDQVNLYSYVGNDPVDGRDPTGAIANMCMSEACKDKAEEAETAAGPPESEENGRGAMGIEADPTGETRSEILGKTNELLTGIGERPAEYVTAPGGHPTWATVNGANARLNETLLGRATARGSYNSELTAAGRALTKHPEVAGLTPQTYQRVLNRPEVANQVGASALRGIMSGTREVVTLPRYGNVIQYRGSDGFGARFYGPGTASPGQFIGFINP